VARRRNKSEERDVAARRIRRLLLLAQSEARSGRTDLADRYARLSLRIAEKYQTGLDAAAKAQVCRKCGAFRVPGVSSRVRVRAGRIVTTCLKCGAVTRRPVASPPPHRAAA
jgi:ribonuclease P protein subunit RPR2